MPKVVLAASTGTVFEYYDFLLYGSLVTFFGALFFPPGNETAALLASLAAFGAGFAIRPLGALIFGVIISGFTFLKLDAYYQEMVKGAIIVGAVVLDQWRQRRRSMRA